MDLLVDFNKAMNNEIEMPDMEVDKALLAMEMYFNYAIVDKQVDYNLKEPYQGQQFEFTVSLGNKISGIELKTKYRSFLIEIKKAMTNKFLKFSDLFVSSKTGSTITFKIIIPPHLDGIPNLNAAMINTPSCSVIREVGDIVAVPEDVVIDWSVYFQNWNSSYHFNNPQHSLHDYCCKALDYFVYGITTNYDNSSGSDWDISQYYFATNGYSPGEPNSFYYYHIFNNQEIMEHLISSTLIEANRLRPNLLEGEVLLDIDIKLDFPYYWDFYNTIAFAGLKIKEYKGGHIVHWLELAENNIDNIIFRV